MQIISSKILFRAYNFIIKSITRSLIIFKKLRKIRVILVIINYIYIFKNYLTKFLKVKENSAFSIFDFLRLKSLTRLRLNISHLNEYEFRHNFRDTINPNEFLRCYSCVAINLLLPDRLSSTYSEKA